MDKREAAKQARMELLKVSAGDFARFLTEVGGDNDSCPVCGCEDWNIGCQGGHESIAFRMGVPVRNVPEIFYLSLFAYGCAKCGYMRFHNAAQVHEWVLANPTVDKPSEEFEQADPEDVNDGGSINE